MVFFISIVVLLIIGFISALKQVRSNAKKIDFANEFHSKADALFNMVLEQGGYQSNEYVWLTKNSNEMQSNMGVFGVMFYMEPFNRASYSNYQIVINTVAKVRQGHFKSFDAVSCTDAILRYIGAEEAKRKGLIKNLKNPFYWFTEGVKIIISIPIYLLNAFGILSDRNAAKAVGSTILKIISGIVALIGFLGSLADAIVGRAEVLSFFKNLFHK